MPAAACRASGHRLAMESYAGPPPEASGGSGGAVQPIQTGPYLPGDSDTRG